MSAKHIFTIVAAGVMLLAACGKKTNTDKDMNTLSFNKEQATTSRSPPRLPNNHAIVPRIIARI